MAEYALESSSQPIGISEYELSKLLPESYKSSLPSIEEIENELQARTLERSRDGISVSHLLNGDREIF